MNGDLQLVMTEKLVIHEEIDRARGKALEKELVNSGVLNQPIKCYPCHDEKKLMILDGHHRFQALTNLGATYIPVQMVSEKQFYLQHWVHSFDNARLCDALRRNVNRRGKKLATLIDHETKQSYDVTMSSEQTQCKPAFIHTLFDYYKERFDYHSLEENSDRRFSIQYNGLRFEDVLQCAKIKQTFPQKITRFLVDRSIQDISVSLSLLFDHRKKTSDVLEILKME